MEVPEAVVTMIMMAIVIMADPVVVRSICRQAALVLCINPVGLICSAVAPVAVVEQEDEPEALAVDSAAVRDAVLVVVSEAAEAVAAVQAADKLKY